MQVHYCVQILVHLLIDEPVSSSQALALGDAQAAIFSDLDVVLEARTEMTGRGEFAVAVSGLATSSKRQEEEGRQFSTYPKFGSLAISDSWSLIGGKGSLFGELTLHVGVRYTFGAGSGSSSCCPRF